MIKKTKQNKTKQNKPKQNKTKQNKTKQNKPKQNKTNQTKTKQNKTNQNKTKQNKTKQNKTNQNKTKQNKTKQNKTKQNKTKQNKSQNKLFKKCLGYNKEAKGCETNDFSMPSRACRESGALVLLLYKKYEKIDRRHTEDRGQKRIAYVSYLTEVGWASNSTRKKHTCL